MSDTDANTPDIVGTAGTGNGVVYDTLGRRSVAHNNLAGTTWNETWTWNARSLLSSHTDRNNTTVGYGWDATSNLKTITYPGSKTLTRAFDDAGRLASTTDWNSKVTSFDYDADSDWTTTTFPGSVNTDSYGYDAAGRMSSATWKQGATTLGAETYTRPTSTKGMVDQVTPSGAAGSTNLDNTYDTRDRLTGTGAESFTYDTANNLTETSDGHLQVFDPAQQLCYTSASATSGSCTNATAGASPSCTPPADATTYTYDSLGNRRSRQSEDEDVRTYGYDQANRLTSVSDTNLGTNDPTSTATDAPIVGDFDGNGKDDLFNYKAGGTNDDIMWWGANRSDFGYSTDTYNVTGTFTPLSGDFNGDGYSDIFWYKPGTGSDYVWFWFGRYGGGYNTYTSTVDATDYTPFVGNFDGDAYSDIYWYRAGSGTDTIWFGDSGAAENNHTYTQDGEDVSGDYRPVTGDFDNDGKDEIFWYGPGSTADSVWHFTSRTAHTSTAKTVSGANYVPVTGDFDGDGYDDVLWNDYTVAGGDAIWWGPGPTFASSKSVTVGLAYFAQAGDFDGDGRTDLFVNHYNAGGDTIWWGTTKADFGTTTGSIGFTLKAGMLNATYQYGTDGIRNAKTVNGTTTTFTWDTSGGLPMLLTQTTGTNTTYLIYGPGDTPIYQYNPDGTIAYYHHDQLGSTRLTTDATGNTLGTITYNAYGQTTTDTTPTTNRPLLGYAGQYLDRETGQQYLRNRYYDPTTSQFLTRDPAILATHEAYGYASQDPWNVSDPQGLCSTHSGVGGWLRDRACSAGDAAGDVGDFIEKHKTEIEIAAVVVGGTALILATGGAGAMALSELAVDEMTAGELDMLLSGTEELGEAGQNAYELSKYGEGLQSASKVVGTGSTLLGAMPSIGSCTSGDLANCVAGVALTAVGFNNPILGFATNLLGLYDFDRLIGCEVDSL